MIKRLFFFTAILMAAVVATAQRSTQSGPGQSPYTGYLFAYFTGNSKVDESIHFAISKDGYHYTALNGDQPVIASEKISETGGVRDPHILRGADGKTFYMVVTDMVSAKGWNSNRAMVLLKSTDLIHWTSSIVNIQKKYKGQEDLLRVWAPQTIYDSKRKKYMVYFSMKHGDGEDIIYYAYANKDFTDLEGTPQQLFYNPDGKACIDADIIYKDGKYNLFYKTESNEKGIRRAVSDSVNGGYKATGGMLQQTTSPVEGAGVFPLNDGSGYILMYDMYTSGSYQFTYSKNLDSFKVVDQEVSMNFHPRHGTVMSLTDKELRALRIQWLTAKDVLLTATSPWIKTQNRYFDTASDRATFPVKPGCNTSAFDPQWKVWPEVAITPAGVADFSKGPVPYTIRIGDRKEKATVQLANYHNPVLNGYYADPEVLYSEKTGKFYIYPTSDGFTNWSGTYFKAFSSPDMVRWTDEGKIIELGKNVQWAKKNAWAPCIVEKKINGVYKYFYYFTAEGKIGVAVANEPTGPFTDIGKPLIDKRPEGVSGGQQIDPDVFTDPVSGKSYFYWGNSYMAGAELNEDMVSLKEGTTQLLTPDKTFREGTYVFYRNGKYYFLWSENDTRDPRYQVRYGVADSPLGKITIPSQNLVIAANPAAGIWGTGHNSVVYNSVTQRWYIVYHRFTYPNGIQMGRAAGYNREVCIDELLFNDDGSIRQVTPTHEGVQ